MILLLRRVVTPRFALAAGVLAVAVAVFDGIGLFLVVADPLTPSDAIVVLDGFTPPRELEGAALYHRGLAPVVIVSRARDPVPEFARHLAGESPPQERTARVLRHLGVPDRAIVKGVVTVENTEEELREAFALAGGRGFRRLILVTSPFHTRRVSLIWRSRYGETIHALVHPTPWEDVAPERWWRSRRSVEATVHEAFGILNFYLGAPLRTFDARR